MNVTIDERTQQGKAEGVPLFPFLSIRDASIDAVSLGKLSSFIRFGAYRAGWLADLNPTFLNKVAAARSDTTVFLVAQLVVLEVAGRYAPLKLPMEASASGVCGVAHCGTSSYSTCVTISAPHPRNGEVCPIGYVANTFVAVNKTTRRPSPLDEQARAKAVAAVKAAASTGLPIRQMSRLDRSWRSASQTPAFRFINRVRPFTDFDFNGHVNQGVYVNLAMDALFAAGVYRPDRDPWVASMLNGDTFAVRAARVDYVREVAKPETELAIEIFDASQTPAASLDFIEELRGREPTSAFHAVWFEVSSAAEDAKEPTLHAFGVLVTETSA